jgi:3-oxoacyl-[acyl-carrier protein] reductase
MRLLGHPCLITGASSGIGRAIALRFAREGAHLVIAARREALLRSLAEEIHAISPRSRVLVVPTDLRDPEQVRRMVEYAHAEFGALEIVVNNAGVGYFAPVTELELPLIEELWAVNVRAAILCTHYVVPRMLERKRGTLIYIASLAGKHGVKNGSVYAATKFALRGFAESVFLEVRSANIRVAVICPGSVATEFAGMGSTPRERALQAEHVAEAALLAASLPIGATVSEIELRPTNPN